MAAAGDPESGPHRRVESQGRAGGKQRASPSLLNGGLFQLEVLPAVLPYGCAKLEQSDLAERGELDLGWNEYANGFGYFGRTPGDFRFDPLNFYKPLDFNGKLSAQERELANGRIAMLAVASYVATEFVTKTPVVYVTPALFEPSIYTATNTLQ